MLAKALNGILPNMTFEEALEITKIQSVAGQLRVEGPGMVTQRPFRAPHHSISTAALTGGGPKARPGEVSLAHGGVLFLDELPEFRRGCAGSAAPAAGGSSSHGGQGQCYGNVSGSVYVGGLNESMPLWAIWNRGMPVHTASDTPISQPHQRPVIGSYGSGSGDGGRFNMRTLLPRRRRKAAKTSSVG